MVFRELETGERYVRRGGASAEGGSLRGFAEEDGAWEWVKVREPAPPDDFALASYREFRVAAGDTMKSMLSSCNVRLKPLSIRAVRDLTSKDELDLAHMGDEGAKVALFASMSDTDSTFDFLFALLMGTAVSALCARGARGARRLAAPRRCTSSSTSSPTSGAYPTSSGQSPSPAAGTSPSR